MQVLFRFYVCLTNMPLDEGERINIFFFYFRNFWQMQFANVSQIWNYGLQRYLIMTNIGNWYWKPNAVFKVEQNKRIMENLSGTHKNYDDEKVQLEKSSIRLVICLKVLK